jgi:hypothetical protein
MMVAEKPAGIPGWVSGGGGVLPTANQFPSQLVGVISAPFRFCAHISTKAAGSAVRANTPPGTVVAGSSTGVPAFTRYCAA